MNELEKLEKEAKEIQEAAEKHNAIMEKNFDNINVTESVQKSIKKFLLKTTDGINTNYDTFIENFFNKALEDPNSKAGQILAQTLVHEDLLKELDDSVNNAISKDIDFMNYRLIKTLFDKQREVFLDTYVRRKAIICSRRSGKTENAARLLLKCCIDQPGSYCYYINLTFTNAIKQVFGLVEKLADDINFPIERKSANEGEIVFKNGSAIEFRGNANVNEREKIQGFKARLVIIDEAQSQKGLEYLVETMVSPLLMDYTDSVLILQGTPPRQPHTYFEKAYNQWGKNADGESKSYNWSMHNNPYIKNVEKEIDKICARKGVTRDNSLIQREYYGKIVYDTEAQVFKNATTYKEIPKEFIPTHLVMGIDLGFSDYNGLAAFVFNKNTKQGYVLKEDKFNKATMSTIIERIRNMYKVSLDWCRDKCAEQGIVFNKDNAIIITDTNEKDLTYELFENYKLPCYTAYKYNKDSAISLLSDLLRTGQIQIPENGYCYDETERVLFKRDEEDNILSEIDDDVFHPDILMALLYAFRQYLFEIGDPLGGESKEKKNNWGQEEVKKVNWDSLVSDYEAEVVNITDGDGLTDGVVWD